MADLFTADCHDFPGNGCNARCHPGLEASKGVSLVSRYWSHFRENLKASLIIGLALSLWILALLLNVDIILQLGTVLRWMLLPVTVALLLAAVFVLLLSFPFMVHYELGLRSMLKNTLYFVVIQPHAAFLCLLLFHSRYGSYSRCRSLFL